VDLRILDPVKRLGDLLGTGRGYRRGTHGFMLIPV
jgi:hypothetical protein